MKTYEEIGAEIGRLVQTKQEAYGDSFSKSGAVMRILYPDGVGADRLDDALTIVRVLDKLFRIATDRDALGESPWRDIAGYALLSVRRVESAKEPEPVILHVDPEALRRSLEEQVKVMNAGRYTGHVYAVEHALKHQAGLDDLKPHHHSPCGALSWNADNSLNLDPCVKGELHLGNHEDSDGCDWAWDARYFPPGYGE